MKKNLFLALLVAAVLAAPCAFAQKCATGLRSSKEGRFAPSPPLARGISIPRTVVPITYENAQTYLTSRFQIIWGNDYDHLDPEWNDSDGDSVPQWIEVIAASLEESCNKFTSMGYPPPYGVQNYYIDVYIGNTGLRIYSPATRTYEELSINPAYYAYTEIDRDYKVAYLVFGADFSPYVQNEIPVLKSVAAHELFHAVQRGAGYPWDAEGPSDGPAYIDQNRWEAEGWWLEASATWMEEEAYPDINDYANYVISFLAEPELPLFYFDYYGVHQYGAAIFMGWVRMMSPGQETLLGILNEAYPKGLEPSLRKYISLYAGDTLEDSVAKFWSLASHPEDYWPDGVHYLSYSWGAPLILAEVNDTPFSYLPTTDRAPGRFGANLFTIDTALLPEKTTIKPRDYAESLTLAISPPGNATPRSSAATLPDLAAPLVPPPGNGSTAYAAVVNTSPVNGIATYRLYLGSTGSSGGGGSGGGCFLEALPFTLTR